MPREKHLRRGGQGCKRQAAGATWQSRAGLPSASSRPPPARWRARRRPRQGRCWHKTARRPLPPSWKASTAIGPSAAAPSPPIPVAALVPGAAAKHPVRRDEKTNRHLPHALARSAGPSPRAIHVLPKPRRSRSIGRRQGAACAARAQLNASQLRLWRGGDNASQGRSRPGIGAAHLVGMGAQRLGPAPAGEYRR